MTFVLDPRKTAIPLESAAVAAGAEHRTGAVIAANRASSAFRLWGPGHSMAMPASLAAPARPEVALPVCLRASRDETTRRRRMADFRTASSVSPDSGGPGAASHSRTYRGPLSSFPVGLRLCSGDSGKRPGQRDRRSRAGWFENWANSTRDCFFRTRRRAGAPRSHPDVAPRRRGGRLQGVGVLVYES